jgi:hypothetical protein
MGAVVSAGRRGMIAQKKSSLFYGDRFLSESKIEFYPGFTVVYTQKFVAGDRTVFEFIYPASASHTVHLSLRGQASLDASGVGDGRNWAVTLTSAQTANLPPGDYAYQAYLVDGSDDRTTIETGSVKVNVNLSTITGNYDGRSELEQLYALVNAAIKALAVDNIKEYQIKERKVVKQDLPMLIQWRDKLKGELSRERQASGQSGSRMLHIRFM